MMGASGLLGGVDWLMLSMGAAVFFIICGTGWGVFALVETVGKKRLKRRITDAAEMGTNPGPNSMKMAMKATIRRDTADDNAGSLDTVIKRVLPRMSLMRLRLDATGKNISLTVYLFASLVVAAIAFFLFAKFGFAMSVNVLAGLAAGIFLPWKVTSMMIEKRQNNFMSLFPEALELMVRGLKSGVPINESMRVVGREIPDPVGDAFRTITDSMLLGRTFNEALVMMSKRLNLADFHFFEISLSIQQETGGNLAETLDGLASTLRKRKQMKLKVRALSSEARATAYILGSLPILMFCALYVMDPDYIGLLIHDPRGHFVLGMAATFLFGGVWVMMKMGQFEI